MTPPLPSTDLKRLYEQDFNLWILATAQQIRSQNFAAVDWNNLLEELKSLGQQ